MKISVFNKTKLSESCIEFTKPNELISILSGGTDISSLCQEIITITGSTICAVILCSAEQPFNIVYSSNMGISFCQNMPILNCCDNIIISNSVEKDIRNKNFFNNMVDNTQKIAERCPLKKMISIPILNENINYGRIIVANRSKGYSVNTIKKIEKQILLISAIIISKDDNLIFSKSGKRNSEITFLSSLSHEIRTPIHGIVNMINLLTTSGTLNERQQKYCECALASCEDLIETVSDSIDYQKIKMNNLGIMNDSFNLREMLTKTKDLVDFKAKQKGIYLELIIEPNVPEMVYGDKDRIRQVLLNIIGNAIKFTSQGGVTIKVHQYPSRIIFTISDSGCGIKKENISKIFNEYYQEDKYSKNGMGLGLSLSKKLIQMMGGGISVTSTYGVGTTFTIDLPLSEERYYLDVSSSDDKEISVLVIDPIEINRITLRKYLKQWKIIVDTTNSFREARKMVDMDIYDIFMINCQQNIGDALSFIHYVDEKFPESRIICIGEVIAQNVFDTYIVSITNKDEVYNALLSVKKKRNAPVHVDIDISDYKVCIVEDDSISAYALEEILKAKGIKNIKIIDNGEQAVRDITHTKYNIVFMDCKLNGDMDGIQVTKIIKEESIYIKIIGVTASITEDEKMLWLNSGLDGLIIKPFTAESVYKVLI